jgi:hypothetical protein
MASASICATIAADCRLVNAKAPLALKAIPNGRLATGIVLTIRLEARSITDTVSARLLATYACVPCGLTAMPSGPAMEPIEIVSTVDRSAVSTTETVPSSELVTYANAPSGRTATKAGRRPTPIGVIVGIDEVSRTNNVSPA